MGILASTFAIALTSCKGHECRTLTTAGNKLAGQPAKQPTDSCFGCFGWFSGCFSAVTPALHQGPTGTLFGCSLGGFQDPAFRASVAGRGHCNSTLERMFASAFSILVLAFRTCQQAQSVPILAGENVRTATEPLIDKSTLQCTTKPAHSGVWTGGIWNGHFPESEKIFFRDGILHKNHRNSAERATFCLPDFRLRILKVKTPQI